MRRQVTNALHHELHVGRELGYLLPFCGVISLELSHFGHQIRHRCRRPGNPDILGLKFTRARELLGLGGVVEQGQLVRLLAKDEPRCVALELDDPSARIDADCQAARTDP